MGFCWSSLGSRSGPSWIYLKLLLAFLGRLGGAQEGRKSVLRGLQRCGTAVAHLRGRFGAVLGLDRDCSGAFLKPFQAFCARLGRAQGAQRSPKKALEMCNGRFTSQVSSWGPSSGVVLSGAVLGSARGRLRALWKFPLAFWAVQEGQASLRQVCELFEDG